jgi:hypothetical protein
MGGQKRRRVLVFENRGRETEGFEKIERFKKKNRNKEEILEK